MCAPDSMTVLLVAVNAKYIHICPAVYSLKAFADRRIGESGLLRRPDTGEENAAAVPEAGLNGAERTPGSGNTGEAETEPADTPGRISVEVSEYTINDRYQDVLSGILSRRADVIAFSVYIWNVDRIRRLIRDIRKVRGSSVRIWAGGPEATYYPEPLLRDGAELCMLGEGEEVFSELVLRTAAAQEAGREKPEAGAADRASDSGDAAGMGPDRMLPDIRGLACLRNGELVSTGMAAPVDMDRIPFIYDDLQAFSHRILYYESSRGCPFACAYCLSGRERGIRFRNPETVERELQIFLDAKVPQVKFIDRTFNASPAHAMRIWHYLQDHDNGVTNFHFEIEGDQLTPEELELLKTFRPGLIQMEIGVQSANPETLQSVRRRAELDRISEAMKALTENQNINLHLDLIAGLPYEDMESFRESFRAVYAMRPHQFQLGFLKLLKGTELYDRREEYGLVCSEDAPYEVLKTRWMSYEDLHLLHRISDRIEEYVNTQGFRRSLPLAEAMFGDAFALFEALADYYRDHGYEQRQPSVFRRYDIFTEFLKEQAARRGQADAAETARLRETVRLDQFLHTHPSRRMTAEETFDFGSGPVRLRFDYRQTSPVHGEAAFYEV